MQHATIVVVVAIAVVSAVVTAVITLVLMYERYQQMTWNGCVKTARIPLEKKGKATERQCSLKCAIQTEKKTERKNTCSMI